MTDKAQGVEGGDVSNTQRAHVLERTSPKGGRFVGFCTLCGEEGLSMEDANRPCDNPAGIGREAALLGVLHNLEEPETDR